MHDQIIAAIKNYTKSIMQKDQTGHGMDHIDRVVRLANKIASTEECDGLVVTAAAYLHDTVDDKLVSDSIHSYNQLSEFLDSLTISASQTEQIIHIIKNISFSQGLTGMADKLSVEGQIVQDADRLDAIGAIGIIRTIYYGGHKGNIIYDPKILPRTLQSKNEYRKESTVINHFYEKIIHLNKGLNTNYAKEIGQKRQAFLEDFLKEFMEEWNE